MMTKVRTIHWFRHDLRLYDNPALYAAAENGAVLPIYIHDNLHFREFKMGAASRVWLHHSLCSLNTSLDGKLATFNLDPLTCLLKLIKAHRITDVVWNRCYAPWQIKRDTDIKIALEAEGVHVRSFQGNLLWEPWTIQKKDSTPYKVFTPFYKKGCLSAQPPRIPLPKPETLDLLDARSNRCTIDELDLHPNHAWGDDLTATWAISEHAAHEKLDRFLDQGLRGYKALRNHPAKQNVSRLSPYLHFGQISPNQAWHATKMLGDGEDVECFRSELAWREFSYALLYFNPNLPIQNLNKKFDHFPWRKSDASLQAWQTGQTGIPIVDAGMRELWQTGYMHNRVRMIVASFLVKNLLIAWQEGARWFWDCLFDADLANNSASWQWVAGCGADAAPYFRIFNPVIQAQKFDPDGDYIRKYVPEIAELENCYLFCPWEAPASTLTSADIQLGLDYPKPIVDLKTSRNSALEAYKALKSI